MIRTTLLAALCAALALPCLIQAEDADPGGADPPTVAPTADPPQDEPSFPIGNETPDMDAPLSSDDGVAEKIPDDEKALAEDFEEVSESPGEAIEETLEYAPPTRRQREPVYVDDEAGPPTYEGGITKLNSKNYDPRIPRYVQEEPSWGVQVGFADTAFIAIANTEFSHRVRFKGVHLQFDYQPKAWREIGIFGIGPEVGFYPINSEGSIRRQLLAAYSASLHLRYQGVFTQSQIIVPMFLAEAGYLQYRFNPDTITRRGGIPIFGARAGAWVLLNHLDPHSAAQFYANYRISRTYLTLEARRTIANTGDMEANRLSYYAGVRMEF